MVTVAEGVIACARLDAAIADVVDAALLHDF
jgi:hypothetical protein